MYDIPFMSTIINMVMMQNFEVIHENIYAEKLTISTTVICKRLITGIKKILTQAGFNPLSLYA
jgi:hypothetical protein